MKNDLQTYSDQMKYCDHCLVFTSLLNVNGIQYHLESEEDVSNKLAVALNWEGGFNANLK